jgi:GTP-binding protein HflX
MVALVGYTNVGKSTLMNLLSKSDVFAENKLFATLDTTTRKMVYDNVPFLMSDTVGFIRKLPHHLVESFKSTLDEVRESDLLLHVVDISHPRYEEQLGVVNKTLQEINAFDKPVIYVFNKMDRYEELNFDAWLEEGTREELLKELKERWEGETQAVCVFMSATERENIDGLREALIERVKGLYRERFPYKTEYLY